MTNGRRWLLAAIALLQVVTAAAAEPAWLLTDSEPPSQRQIGRDLAQYVANAAGLDLQVVPTSGPTETLQRLRDDRKPGLKLALLQSDIANAYLSAAERGNPEAARWLEPLRVVAPLYDEQLYFLVRSDSGLESLHDIRDARINVGPLAGGTALAVAALYRLLFDAPVPSGRLRFLGHEQALAKLLTDRSVDVVALLADPPVRLLANMKPEARRFVRLLRFDAAAARSDDVLRVFSQNRIRAESYPNLLSDDVPALASRIYLVAHGDPPAGNEALAAFKRAWCLNLPLLQSAGHPQWREAAADSPELRAGWRHADLEPCR